MFELKQLLDTQKYAYLDEKKIYHVIISANLTEHEEERLLKVLRKHGALIGYTLDYLKGISPTLCQRKINMEPDAKPVTALEYLTEICNCTHASCQKFLKIELRFVETLRNQFKNNQL